MTNEEIVTFAALGVGGLALGKIVLDQLGDGSPMKLDRSEDVGEIERGGPPAPAIGGVSDYGKIAIAQKVEAVRRFGEYPRTADMAIVPIVTVRYALEQVASYWTGEINRLCGLSGEGNGGTIFNPSAPAGEITLSHRPRGTTEAGITVLNYRGEVSIESCDAILRAWNSIGAQMLAGIVEGAQPSEAFKKDRELNRDGAIMFWRAVGRAGVSLDVDRATPKMPPPGFLWTAIVDSAQELPGKAGEVARAFAREIAGGALAFLWSLLGSPIVLIALAGGLYLYRSELSGVIARVKP